MIGDDNHWCHSRTAKFTHNFDSVLVGQVVVEHEQVERAFGQHAPRLLMTDGGHSRVIFVFENPLQRNKNVFIIVENNYSCRQTLNAERAQRGSPGHGAAMNCQNLKPIARTTVASVHPPLKMYVVKSIFLWEKPATKPLCTSRGVRYARVLCETSPARNQSVGE